MFIKLRAVGPIHLVAKGSTVVKKVMMDGDPSDRHMSDYFSSDPKFHRLSKSPHTLALTRHFTNGN